MADCGSDEIGNCGQFNLCPSDRRLLCCGESGGSANRRDANRR